LEGTALIGPNIISSYSLSTTYFGGKGSDQINSGRAKLTKVFLLCSTSISDYCLIISIPQIPTINAVLVAIAGIILPAIILT